MIAAHASNRPRNRIASASKQRQAMALRLRERLT
jgi:hypothetical protein